MTRRSQTSITDSSSYDTLYKVLQEKERDLELAAHIGQLLLKRNELLESDMGSLLDHRQALEQEVCVCHRSTHMCGFGFYGEVCVCVWGGGVGWTRYTPV